MKRIIKIVIAVLVLTGGAILVAQCRPSSDAQRRDQHAHEHEYFCPMHPQVVQDKPGTCPICSMKLEEREKAPARPATPTAPARTQ